MRVRAVLFDYGGTLDGPGSHWLDRFLQVYRDAGQSLTFEQFRGAFDHATRCGYAEPAAAQFGLQALIEFHVAHQMERLRIVDGALAARVVATFVDASRQALRESRIVLERLRPRVALGVISNFYGNVDRILEEAGMAALFSAIIDSNRVGVSKPAPEIFALAVQRIGCAPSEALYVGDSFEKDVLGARAAGLRTAWLMGEHTRPCPSPALVDAQLRCLADIEALLE